MRLAAVSLATLAALLGLAATWLAAASGEAPPRRIVLALAGCVLALGGAGLVARGRARLGAGLLAEALLGLGFGIGEYALIPGALLLAAVLLAWLGRGGRRRGPPGRS